MTQWSTNTTASMNNNSDETNHFVGEISFNLHLSCKNIHHVGERKEDLNISNHNTGFLYQQLKIWGLCHFGTFFMRSHVLTFWNWSMCWTEKLPFQSFFFFFFLGHFHVLICRNRDFKNAAAKNPQRRVTDKKTVNWQVLKLRQRVKVYSALHFIKLFTTLRNNEKKKGSWHPTGHIFFLYELQLRSCILEWLHTACKLKFFFLKCTETFAQRKCF